MSRPGSGSWKHITEAVAPNRMPTPAQQAAIDGVLELAESWSAGGIPTGEGRQLCSGPERWLATRFTPPADRRFGLLMRMLDALIDADGDVRTRHGVFTTDDVVAAETIIVREDGVDLIIFPVRYPWRIKPDRERNVAGERNAAVFRPASERGPKTPDFDTAPAPGADAPWWEG